MGEREGERVRDGRERARGRGREGQEERGRDGERYGEGKVM